MLTPAPVWDRGLKQKALNVKNVVGSARWTVEQRLKLGTVSEWFSVVGG